MQLPGLKAQRELRFLSQRALSARAAVSIPTIIAAEKGGEVTPRVAQAITRALELVPVSSVVEQLVGASPP